MRVKRIYQDETITEGAVIVLTKENNHYLQQVLRTKSDEIVILIDGHGNCAKCSYQIIDKRTSQLHVKEVTSNSCESPVRTTLIQALSKGEKMDFTIQKSVELGVNQIVPVISDYSVVKLDQKRQNKKLDHWQGVANAATLQSGRTYLTNIEAITSLKEYLDNHPLSDNETGITLSPHATASIKEIGLCAGYRLMIGPEGGFSELEIEMLKECGYKAVSMGPRVLRTETAALTALSVIQSKWGDF
jgi:16S rRNA (uracil1498-N3)-methyltransferase